MPSREFEITIAADGSVEVSVQGYKGKRCLEAMKIFQEVVGEMQSQKLTHEFYAPEEDVRINVERQH
jgi:hypothetical protein